MVEKINHEYIELFEIQKGDYELKHLISHMTSTQDMDLLERYAVNRAHFAVKQNLFISKFGSILTNVDNAWKKSQRELEISLEILKMCETPKLEPIKSILKHESTRSKDDLCFGLDAMSYFRADEVKIDRDEKSEAAGQPPVLSRNTSEQMTASTKEQEGSQPSIISYLSSPARSVRSVPRQGSNRLLFSNPSPKKMKFKENTYLMTTVVNRCRPVFLK